MPPVNFTLQDAQSVVNLAQNAPLKNLTEASHAADLLQRFAAWAQQHVTAPVAAPAAPAAPAVPAVSPTAKAVRAAIKASTPAAPPAPKTNSATRFVPGKRVGVKK